MMMVKEKLQGTVRRANQARPTGPGLSRLQSGPRGLVRRYGRCWAPLLWTHLHQLPELDLIDGPVGGRVGRARWRLMRNFKPLFVLTGTGQGWALFATPDSYPQRLEVWIGVGDEERLVWSHSGSHRSFISFVEIHSGTLY